MMRRQTFSHLASAAILLASCRFRSATCSCPAGDAQVGGRFYYLGAGGSQVQYKDGRLSCEGAGRVVATFENRAEFDALTGDSTRTLISNSFRSFKKQ